jgi:hypothetical protein
MGETQIHHGKAQGVKGLGNFSKGFQPKPRVLVSDGTDFQIKDVRKTVTTHPGPGAYNPYKPGKELRPAYTIQERNYPPTTAQDSKGWWAIAQPGPGRYAHYTLHGKREARKKGCSPTWGAGRMRIEDVPGEEFPGEAGDKKEKEAEEIQTRVANRLMS